MYIKQGDFHKVLFTLPDQTTFYDWKKYDRHWYDQRDGFPHPNPYMKIPLSNIWDSDLHVLFNYYVKIPMLDIIQCLSEGFSQNV